jgi:hypothetical protein
MEAGSLCHLPPLVFYHLYDLSKNILAQLSPDYF